MKAPHHLASLLFFFFLLTVFFRLPLQSEEAARYNGTENDTLSVHSTDTIISSATATNRLLTGVGTESIDIEEVPSNRIESALLRNSSVFINNYGGKGGVSTISIRGGNPSSTLILMNGMRLSSSQTGILDLSLLSPNLFSSAAIKKTGASVSFGSNAMAGVLNLSSAVSNESKYGLSYGLYNDVGLYGRQVISDNISVGLSYDSFSGRYPYLFSGESFQRENADYQRFNAMVDLSSSEMHHTSLWIHSSDRGVPGPHIYRRAENSTDRLSDAIGMLTHRSSFGSIDDIGVVGIGGSLKYQVSDINSSVLAKSREFSYNSFDAQVRFEYSLESSIIDLNIINEGGFSFLDGDNLDPSVNSYVDRKWNGLSITLSKSLTESNSFSVNILGGARGDYYSDKGFYPTAMFGMYMKVNDNISIKTEPSYNVRVPSFNEMYYLNYGNGDLIPETSINIPLDLRYQNAIFETWQWSIDASMFANSYQNMILSIPRNAVLFTAQNIGKSRIYGLESKLAIFNENVDFSVSYLRQEPEELTKNGYTILPNVPLEIVNANISILYDSYKLLVSGRHTSHRYSQRGEYIQDLIESYFVLDAQVSYSFDITEYQTSEIIFFVDNLSDTDYQIIANYPMPGILAGVKLNYTF